MLSVSQAQAVADRGLEGDRFFRESWSSAGRPDKAVTLIEEETIKAAAGELGAELVAGEIRRNIVTRGVPLLDLLNCEFTIGGVVMRGLRLFEPCAHLERVSKASGICRALVHRSGLKAAILEKNYTLVSEEAMPGLEKIPKLQSRFLGLCELKGFPGLHRVYQI